TSSESRFTFRTWESRGVYSAVENRELSVVKRLMKVLTVFRGARILESARLHARIWPHFVTPMALSAVLLAVTFCGGAGAAQSGNGKPVVVQPGAPGQPSKTLPSSTTGTLPPLSRADVEFMQGMIMHHAQAVEMTAMIESHTANKELRALGAKIS